MPRPEIEKLLDAELQVISEINLKININININNSIIIIIKQLNNQIIINKRCYAQLYAKLITADIEREKNQINKIEQRFLDWSSFVLNNEIKNLE